MDLAKQGPSGISLDEKFTHVHTHVHTHIHTHTHIQYKKEIEQKAAW